MTIMRCFAALAMTVIFGGHCFHPIALRRPRGRLIRTGWKATCAGCSNSVGEALPILLVPDPTLRAKCRPVGPQDTDAVRALLPRLFATMYDAPGIGLAAPQIGQKLALSWWMFGQTRCVSRLP